VDEQAGDRVRAALALHSVSVAYDGNAVVQNVSVEIGNGQWLGLVGPNGAGKTSLLKAVAGLVAYDGEVDISGLPAGHNRRRALARHVAYVPQDPAMPAGMTVAEYVLLGRTAHLPYFRMEGRSDFAVVEEVLAQLELASFAARPLSALSGGEQQRAVLARALAQQSPILLLDEPTNALDVGHQQQVLELVESLRQQRDLAVVSAMHDLTLAGQFADRLLMLARGRAVAVGPPAAVLTEACISEHWGARVRVLEHPDGGVAVIPVRPRREEKQVADAARASY
jgi:iron complex transport system ATP-binding protein